MTRSLSVFSHLKMASNAKMLQQRMMRSRQEYNEKESLARVKDFLCEHASVKQTEIEARVPVKHTMVVPPVITERTQVMDTDSVARVNTREKETVARVSVARVNAREQEATARARVNDFFAQLETQSCHGDGFSSARVTEEETLARMDERLKNSLSFNLQEEHRKMNELVGRRSAAVVAPLQVVTAVPTENKQIEVPVPFVAPVKLTPAHVVAPLQVVAAVPVKNKQIEAPQEVVAPLQVVAPAPAENKQIKPPEEVVAPVPVVAPVKPTSANVVNVYVTWWMQLFLWIKSFWPTSKAKSSKTPAITSKKPCFPQAQLGFVETRIEKRVTKEIVTSIDELCSELLGCVLKDCPETVVVPAVQETSSAVSPMEEAPAVVRSVQKAPEVEKALAVLSLVQEVPPPAPMPLVQEVPPPAPMPLVPPLPPPPPPTEFKPKLKKHTDSVPAVPPPNSKPKISTGSGHSVSKDMITSARAGLKRTVKASDAAEASPEASAEASAEAEASAAAAAKAKAEAAALNADAKRLQKIAHTKWLEDQLKKRMNGAAGRNDGESDDEPEPTEADLKERQDRIDKQEENRKARAERERLLAEKQAEKEAQDQALKKAIEPSDYDKSLAKWKEDKTGMSDQQAKKMYDRFLASQ